MALLLALRNSKFAIRVVFVGTELYPLKTRTGSSPGWTPGKLKTITTVRTIAASRTKRFVFTARYIAERRGHRPRAACGQHIAKRDRAVRCGEWLGKEETVFTSSWGR